MNKIILAICGPSAAGKDTLAQWLHKVLEMHGYSSKILISDTTRPPRVNESNGFNYNFIDKQTFYYNLALGRYLEHSQFNGWLYGTNNSSCSADINIGVFNPEGLQQLKDIENFNVIPIYLSLGLLERLKRSYNREGKWKIEFLRRAWTDYKDFDNIKELLEEFNNYIPIPENIDNVITKATIVYNYLVTEKLLPLGKIV